MWTDGCTKESKSRVSQRQKPKLDRWTTNIITRTESAGDKKTTTKKPDVDKRTSQRQRTKDKKTDHTDRQTDENKVSQRQRTKG